MRNSAQIFLATLRNNTLNSFWFQQKLRKCYVIFRSSVIVRPSNLSIAFNFHFSALLSAFSELFIGYLSEHTLSDSLKYCVLFHKALQLWTGDPVRWQRRDCPQSQQTSGGNETSICREYFRWWMSNYFYMDILSRLSYLFSSSNCWLQQDDPRPVLPHPPDYFLYESCFCLNLKERDQSIGVTKTLW